MAIEEENNNIIEVTDEDGSIIKCELYDIIEFEEKQYALLIEVDSENSEEEPELVLMRLIENGDSDEVFFETIEDDDEFERVQAYIESLPEEDIEDEE